MVLLLGSEARPLLVPGLLVAVLEDRAGPGEGFRDCPGDCFLKT